jgi:cytochrome c oxidase accessory protein FixG
MSVTIPEPEPEEKDRTGGDFRDRLATADREGHRRWVYPKKVSGRFFRLRTWVSWGLLVILFTGPFVRINGNPLLLFNIVDRRFSILGQIFWPQDMAIFAIAMLLFLTGIIVFTTAFGRLWCGWTCPQTLLMEMVFRKLEYLIEGDARAQKALDAAPWNARKWRIKGFKHAVFFTLSFVIANTLLSYIIGTEKLFQIVTDPPALHLKGLSAMILFTFVFYAIFAHFREQACTFICPYGRFQSTMLDENTIVVAYDHVRGENRAVLRGRSTAAERRSHGLGDCIDCLQCVAVCPTGIDIRNGTQMECINCTACIDACDGVMQKIGRPRGLVRYASLNAIERGEKFRITPRMIGYSVVLCLLGLLLGFLIFTRSIVETTLLRAPGALYQQTTEGTIENIYTLKLVNKVSRRMEIELKLENVAGKLKVMGGDRLVVPSEQLITASILIELPLQVIKGPSTRLKIGVYAGGKRIETVNTVFVGPRNL